MVRRLFDHQSSSIVSAAFLLAAIGVASLLLGFFRNTLLAAYFGAGDELDIYFASFRIPDFLFNAFFLGSLSAGFIPVFTSHWAENQRDAAWFLTTNMLHTILAAFAFASLALIVVTPWIMPFVVPGFSDEKLRLTVHLTRIILFQPIILAVSSVFSGVLQSLRRFFMYALAPVVYNLGIILGIVAFTPFFGLTGLGMGVIVGASLHALVQVPQLRRVGYRHEWLWDIHRSDFRKVIALMIPRSLTLIIVQINLLVITIIASMIGEGALSRFNFAFDLQGFPIRLIGVSFAVAAFPALARLAQKDTFLFGKTLVGTMRQIGFFLVPASALFFILRAQIVRIVLGYGKFAEGWNDTRITAALLGIFAFGILAQGLYLIFIRAFFALHDTKTPLFIGTVSAVVNIFLSYFFARRWGVSGLALAFISASAIQVALLLAFLRARIRNAFPLGELIEGYMWFSLTAFVAAVNAFATLYLLADIIPTNTVFGIFSQASIAGIVGAGSYLLFCALVHLPEADEFFATLRQGFRRVSLPPEVNGGPRR